MSKWITLTAGLAVCAVAGCDSRMGETTPPKTERVIVQPPEPEKKGAKVDVRVNPTDGVKVDVEKNRK